VLSAEVERQVIRAVGYLHLATTLWTNVLGNVRVRSYRLKRQIVGVCSNGSVSSRGSVRVTHAKNGKGIRHDFLSPET
jgi:hypothetical protein